MPGQPPNPVPSVPKSKTTTHACSVPPPSHLKSENANYKGYAVTSVDVWPIQFEYFQDGKRKLKYYFLHTRGWTQNREDAVMYTIKGGHAAERKFETWEDWANINFEPADVGNADIRIGFEPGASWSAVGSGADKIDGKKPTLNLGWLKDAAIPTPEDRSTILHEFGHALGMMHEHQSPARGEYIHLKELEVYRYYEPLLGNRATVKSQIIDTYNAEKIMNMSKLDLESIMMYYMPAYLNEEGIDIPVNKELSKLDKAFIMLNYPPDLRDTVKLKRFIQALIDAGVTDKAAGEILNAFNTPNPEATVEKPDTEENPDLPYRFGEMRAKFSEYNKRTTHLRGANAKLLNAIDPESLTQFGIKDFLGNVINNKLFQSVVKSVVKNTLTQQGIPLKRSIPGASPPEVARMIGGLVTHPRVAEYVEAYNEDLRVTRVGRAKTTQNGSGDTQHAVLGTA